MREPPSPPPNAPPSPFRVGLLAGPKFLSFQLQRGVCVRSSVCVCALFPRGRQLLALLGSSASFCSRVLLLCSGSAIHSFQIQAKQEDCVSLSLCTLTEGHSHSAPIRYIGRDKSVPMPGWQSVWHRLVSCQELLLFLSSVFCFFPPF
jgi:hypothetical protein